MAIRYLGDVELRMQRRGTNVHVTMRTPRRRHTEVVSVGLFDTLFRDPSSIYDSVALKVARRMLKREPHLPLEYDENGGIVVRRVFQAPCPMKLPKRHRKRKRP